MTLETVAGDTPAAFATALIVVAPDRDATGFSRRVCGAATDATYPECIRESGFSTGFPGMW
jgi:hypothetical protein